jgi:hypothetical protein
VYLYLKEQLARTLNSKGDSAIAPSLQRYERVWSSNRDRIVSHENPLDVDAATFRRSEGGLKTGFQ